MAPVNNQTNTFANIPGLTWIGTANFPALLFATASSVPFVLLYLLTGVLTNPESGLQTVTVIFVAMHILTVASWVQRTKGNLLDIEALAKLTNQRLSDGQQCTLHETRAANFITLCGSFLLGAMFFFTGRIIGGPVPAAVVIDEIIREYIYLEGPIELVAWNYIAILQFFIIGTAVVFGIVSQSRHNRVMKALCDSLDINLLNTDQLAVVGGPLLRALAAPVFLLAATGPFLFINEGASSDGFYLLAVPTALLLTAFAATALPPMLAVRRKVIEAKRQELSIIELYLQGDKQAMSKSQVSHLQDSFTAMEVLEYRDRVAAIWDWPLHGQLIKLMLYLIIPPLAWAAAALVERVVDAALG
ncbi:MAG: hypothetical protein ACE37D_15580 [Pseudomonadales bacterium]